MATASGSVKPVTLELGGKSPMPMIVFEDADWCYDGQLSVSRPGTWVLLIFSLRCFFSGLLQWYSRICSQENQNQRCVCEQTRAESGVSSRWTSHERGHPSWSSHISRSRSKSTQVHRISQRRGKDNEREEGTQREIFYVRRAVTFYAAEKL